MYFSLYIVLYNDNNYVSLYILSSYIMKHNYCDYTRRCIITTNVSLIHKIYFCYTRRCIITTNISYYIMTTNISLIHKMYFSLYETMYNDNIYSSLYKRVYNENKHS